MNSWLIWMKSLISRDMKLAGPGQLGSQDAVRRSEISWQWLAVATRQLFQPRSWLWWVVSISSTRGAASMPFYADQSPGFENNTAEMRPRFKAIQSYLRCHVSKTNCTACCTSLPLSLCDRNSLFECTTAVVTITDKLGMLQAWMGAKPLPGNWSTEWLFPWSSKSSWLDGLLPPYFSHSPNPLPHFLTRP